MANTLNVKLKLSTDAFTRSMKKVEREMRRSGSKMKRIGEEMSTSFSIAFGDFSALAIKAGGDFEESMNGVVAVTKGAEKQFQALNDKAKELGKTTSFSASESAKAIEMLGRNGLNATQILDGAADATIKLAEATKADLSIAADIATDAMGQFKISADQMNTVVDLIAGTTSNSKFAIEDFQLAMAQAGGIAGAVGVNFKDFTTSIAAISPAFASGSDAGTSFKTFLTRLIPESKVARNKMKELGIITADGRNQFFEASGKMKGMSDISEILAKTLGKLSDKQKNAAAKILFGTDAMRAAIMMSETGAEKFNELSKSIESVSAAEMAAKRMEGFNGAMKRLQSSFEALLIAFVESGLLSHLTGFVERLTDVFVQLSSTNPVLFRLATAFGLIVAAIGPALMIFGQVKIAIAALAGVIGLVAKGWMVFNAALTVSVPILQGITLSLGPIVIGFTAIAGAIALVVGHIRKMNAVMDLNSQKRKVLKDVQDEAIANTEVERVKVDNLIKTINNENTSKKNKIAALKELQKISPEYFGGLDHEKISTDKLTAAGEKYNTMLLQRAKIRAAEDKLTEIASKKLDLQRQLEEGRTGGLMGELSRMTRGTVFQGIGGIGEGKGLSNTLSQLEALKAQEEALVKVIGQWGRLQNGDGDGDGDVDVDVPVFPVFPAPTVTSDIKKQTEAIKEQAAAVQNLVTVQQLQGVAMTQSVQPLNSYALALDRVKTSGVSVKSELQLLAEALNGFNNNLNGIINDGMVNFLSAVGDLGGQLAAGEIGVKQFASGVLKTVTGVMSSLGDLAIKTGIGVAAIKLALQSLNPAVAIAAGIALKGFASFINSKMEALATPMAKGGIVLPTPGGTLAQIGEAGKAEAVIPLDRLGSMMRNNGSGGGGTLTTEISGRNLYFVLHRYMQDSGRTF